MQMYNRYQGNTGKVVRVEEPHEKRHGGSHPQGGEKGNGATTAHHAHHSAPAPAYKPRKPRSIFPSLSGDREKTKLEKSLGGLLKKLDPTKLEFEDILLMAVLYLLYRESGDEELLIMLGVMFLL